MSKAAAILALALPVLASLYAGQRVFGLVVAVLAAIVLADAAGLFARAGARPILLAAALPGIALPASLALDGATGWRVLPAWFVVGLLAAFGLAIIFGRRSGVAGGLAATSLCSLLVGLGAAGLIMLAGLPEGRSWVLGFAALLGAAEGGAVVLSRRRAGPRWAFDQAGAAAARPVPLAGAQAVWASLFSVVVVGGVLAVVFGDPFAPPLVAGVGLIAVIAALGGAFLHRIAAVEAGLDDDRRQGLGSGLLLSVADGALIGAPLAYVLARSAVV